jgi:uncharacterized protein YggE
MGQYTYKEQTMKTKMFIIGLVIAALLSACAPTNEKNPNPRTVSVAGTAKVTMTPDIAYINLGVHTEAPTASQAVSDNNASANKLMEALKAAGVADKDIQTVNFSVTPSPKFDPQTGKQTGITYVVDNTVRVTVRDLKSLGGLLDASVKAGSNSINSIQFDVEDKSDYLSQARTAAVKDAEAQAQELASAAGVALGDVQTISYYENIPVPLEKTGNFLAAADAGSVPISPGTMDLTVTVNVVYFIK